MMVTKWLTTDLRGLPTLERAREVFNSMFTIEDWNIGIRGPEHDNFKWL